MRNNLKLITTETFGDLSYNFYRNMNDDILLTREQIGSALEYSNPQKAIQKIHSSHKDRLETLCMRIIENRVPQNGGCRCRCRNSLLHSKMYYGNLSLVKTT